MVPLILLILLHILLYFATTVFMKMLQINYSHLECVIFISRPRAVLIGETPDMHIQNKKCGNFGYISLLTGKCAARKLKKKWQF